MGSFGQIDERHDGFPVPIFGGGHVTESAGNTANRLYVVVQRVIRVHDSHDTAKVPVGNGKFPDHGGGIFRFGLVVVVIRGVDLADCLLVFGGGDRILDTEAVSLGVLGTAELTLRGLGASRLLAVRAIGSELCRGHGHLHMLAFRPPYPVSG